MAVASPQGVKDMERYLIIKGSGGLSNRIQAALAGIGYCLLTGRTLCVDWRDGLYSNAFENVFPLYFTVPGLGAVDVPPPVSTQATIFPEFWRDRLADPVAVEYLFDNDHLSRAVRDATCLDFTRTDYGQDILVGWGVDLAPALSLAPLLARDVPGFSGRKPHEACRDLLRGYLRPVPELAGAVEDFASARFSPSGMIGAHIRHTDLKAPLDAFVRVIREIMEKTGYGLFLTTDNRQVQATFCRLFPGTVHTEKFFPGPGEPLHAYYEGQDNARKGFEALVDMYLLGRCRHIVHYAPSSFARVPILLSGLPGERITAIGG
ncbi:hypothetical protein ASZ90_002409 [hydrocarbon metagenome]|uniref:Uncharacterized protein n=1 Tax=hydrocarbon metagenome TaxID=938273 RepID=A0A0W8G448_9ZZZZ